jgi:hypothetical protein
MPETDNDPSASTASFRAFAERSDGDYVPAKRPPVSRGVIIAIVVGVLIIIGILVATV